MMAVSNCPTTTDQTNLAVLGVQQPYQTQGYTSTVKQFCIEMQVAHPMTHHGSTDGFFGSSIFLRNQPEWTWHMLCTNVQDL